MATMSIFVSHSHTDDAFCQQLVGALRHADTDTWYDEENLGAAHLMDVIERELRVRPVFLVILSPAALASRWVKDECIWAYNRYRKDPTRIILPILAVPVPEDDIWLFLQEFKRVERPGCLPYPADEAVRQMLKALALAPRSEAAYASADSGDENLAEDLLALGKALEAQRRHREAIPLLERATRLRPDSFEAWANVARAHAELNEAEPALAAAEQALQLEPSNAMAWSAKSGALMLLSRNEEALIASERAKALDPSDTIIWTDRGNALYSLNRYQEALAAYEQALALDPKYTFAWNGKGSTLYSLNRYQEALATYEQALTFDPKLAQAWNGKAAALYSLNRYQEALAAYEQRLMLAAPSVPALQGKALALRALGRTQEADQADAQAKALGG